MIYAIDIPDAWFQALRYATDNGRRYTVEKGSFEGTQRLELDAIMIHINHPYAEPYDAMLPKIPPAYGIPDPVAPGWPAQGSTGIHPGTGASGPAAK